MTLPTSRYRRPAFAAALLAASALSGVAGWSAAPALAQAQTAPAATAPISVDRPAAQALPGFADLAQRVGPAVVTITTTSRQAADEEGSPFQQGSPGDRRFGQYFGGREQGAARTVHALGIVDQGDQGLPVVLEGFTTVVQQHQFVAKGHDDGVLIERIIGWGVTERLRFGG